MNSTRTRVYVAVACAIFGALILAIAAKATTTHSVVMVPTTHPPSCVGTDGQQAIYESNADGTLVDGTRYRVGETFRRSFGSTFSVTFRFNPNTTFTIQVTRDQCPTPPTTSSTSTSSTVVESTTTTSPSSSTTSPSTTSTPSTPTVPSTVPTTVPPPTVPIVPPPTIAPPDHSVGVTDECVTGTPDVIRIHVQVFDSQPWTTYVLWWDGDAYGFGHDGIPVGERFLEEQARVHGSSAILRVEADGEEIFARVIDLSPCTGAPTTLPPATTTTLPGVNAGLGTGGEDG